MARRPDAPSWSLVGAFTAPRPPARNAPAAVWRVFADQIKDLRFSAERWSVSPGRCQRCGKPTIHHFVLRDGCGRQCVVGFRCLCRIGDAETVRRARGMARHRRG